MELCAHVAARRRALGLSQETLAAQLGVSRQAVSKWETGEALPDLQKAAALAGALGLSLDELCGAPARENVPVAMEAHAAKPKPARRLLVAFCALLLLVGSFYVGTHFAPAPVPSPPALPETVTVSGVQFSVSDGLCSFSFVPSSINSAYGYTVVFSGSENRYTEEVSCIDGVCAGNVMLGAGGYFTVVLLVTSGSECRAVPVAEQLHVGYRENAVSWTAPG